MRWIQKEQPRIRVGDTRVVSRFLLFPKNIGGEWRWMERAAWKQEYMEFWGMMEDGNEYRWVDSKWEEV